MDDPETETEGAMELTGSEGGTWRVVTRDSQHFFDFDKGSVTRVPGLDASPSINDRPRPLRSIDALKVGARGRWSMGTDGWSETVDFFWHISSTIARIERIDAANAFGTDRAVPD